MAIEKKLTWFRMHGSIQGTLEQIDTEKVGQALKDALNYFNFGEVPKYEDIESRIAFGTIKQGIDESLQEYAQRREDGRRGAQERKAREEALKAQVEELSRINGGDEPFPCLTEDDENDLPFE